MLKLFCLFLTVGTFPSDFKDNKSFINHKTAEIKVSLNLFACWCKDPNPHIYLRIRILVANNFRILRIRNTTEMPQKTANLRLVASSSSATTSWRASSGVRPSSTLSGGARLLLSWDGIHKSKFDERLLLSWDRIHKSHFGERLWLSWDRIHKSHSDERLLLSWDGIHKSHFDESLKTFGSWLFTIPGFFSDFVYFLVPPR